MKRFAIVFAVVVLFMQTGLFAQEPPMGSPGSPNDKEAKALAALKGTIKGLIVWSTSRSNTKHDLWIMNADGTDPKQLTKGDNVDWFPRFSPSGTKILFTRSKSGWVSENDAEFNDKWDLFTINVDGTGEQKVADNATWGNYMDEATISFARGAKVFTKNLSTGAEEEIFDANVIKKGTIAQQPQMSPNGKYIGITLRGAFRETGIWDREKKSWAKISGGCQITWMPSGEEVYWDNPTGNGGSAAPSEIQIIKVADGKPVGDINDIKKNKLMDLPGRRSHEYFPRFDQTGEYLVWGATDKGHDHDLYDYEIYIWKRGTPMDSAVRLTFHSGNDRWPDIFIQK